MNSDRADSSFAPLAVVLAIYAPDECFLEQQIASLADQTHPVSKVVVVVADGLSSKLATRLCAKHGLSVDIVAPDSTTPSIRSFEIGLAHALEIVPENAIFALCDQDDIWHPEKLAVSVRCLKETGASLVHTDARVVGVNGEKQHQSLFRLERRLIADNLRALLLKNTVTGMTIVMTRQVVSASIPFPAQSALFFHHDLWLGLVASVLDGVGFVNQPLVDYRQHDRNVIGAVDSAREVPRIGTKAWYRHWASTYSVAAYLAKSLYLRVEEVAASKVAHPDQKRIKKLRPYLSRRSVGVEFLGDSFKFLATGNLDLARQSIMFFCVRLGRLGWALRNSLSDDLMSAIVEFDRRSFSMAPGAQPGTTDRSTDIESRSLVASSFRELRVARKFDFSMKRSIQKRIVILVPSLNPTEIFAGIATAIDIGVGLAQRGAQVLFLAVDLPIESRERTLNFIADRAGAPRFFALSRIKIACGVTDQVIEFHTEDRFLATAWWSAHLIRDILDQGEFLNAKFHYLIQDFEPGFYPWGGEYAGAYESYQFDFKPIFNSNSLRKYFEDLGLSPPGGAALTFHPSIDLERYQNLKRQNRARRRLVLYGRPEVARNMFATALESIEEFLLREMFGHREIELLSVGLAHSDIKFSGGLTLRSLGKIPWSEYPQFLSTVDVGLSLMLSPHPSHPPLEMAAAGAQVVTNKFASKDLGLLTPSIHSVEPNAKEISKSLSRAWAASPASGSERQLDLRLLGSPLDHVVDALFDDLQIQKFELAVAG
ncbi:MAG: glycosyltransferase [Boseongicola sp.]